MNTNASRPKLAILVHAVGSGSVGAVALHHARELSRTFDVELLSRDGPPLGWKGLTHRRVACRSWNWLRRFGHLPNEIAFLRAARRLLQDNPPDLLWCHSHAAAALVGTPLRTREGTRVVMTTHGDIFDRPAGTYSRDLTWFYRRVTARAYRESDAVHALSPYMARLACERGAAPGKVQFIPNGIEPADLGLQEIPERPLESFLPEGRMRLLFVGSLWKLKGIDTLLHALASLVTEGGFGPWSLEIVGEGPEETFLRSLATSLGLDESVRFRGGVARAELPLYYASADALCLPSLSEAFPTVALEAMMLGVPIVGSNTGGIPELVQPGINGWLFASADAKALARELRRARGSAALLYEYGRNAARRVEIEFAWPTLGRQLERLAVSCLPDGQRQRTAA